MQIRVPVQMRKKYGDITMLDFPQFTKDTFPGAFTWTSGRRSGRKWLERFASTAVHGDEGQYLSSTQVLTPAPATEPAR